MELVVPVPFVGLVGISQQIYHLRDPLLCSPRPRLGLFPATANSGRVMAKEHGLIIIIMHLLDLAPEGWLASPDNK
jgi:hypothetical protein